MKRFCQVAAFLPDRIKNILLQLDDRQKEKIQEIRIRVSGPLSLTSVDGNLFLTEQGRISILPRDNLLSASVQEITECFQRICRYSVHSYQDKLVKGFITLPGGHRAGLCGTAVMGGGVENIRNISSINLRIAREIKGAANPLISEIRKQPERLSMLIAGPPASGKTTLLRDLVRQLSSGALGMPLRIAVIDERSEIAAVSSGESCNSLGPCTDVFDGYPKSAAMELAIRTMSPQVMVCDELGGSEEIQAVKSAAVAGVAVIASVHAAEVNELMVNPRIKELIHPAFFDRIVLLDSFTPGELRGIYSTKEIQNENSRNSGFDYGLLGDRSNAVSQAV